MSQIKEAIEKLETQAKDINSLKTFLCVTEIGNVEALAKLQEQPPAEELMKGWDKPFERWEIKKSNTEFYFHIESTGRQEIAFKLNNTGNWFYASISESEEIWHALGHAIADLKRKQ